jgi:hypothetical protein
MYSRAAKRPTSPSSLRRFVDGELGDQRVTHAAQELDLVGLLERLGLSVPLEEVAQALQPSIDRRQCVFRAAGGERLLGAGAGPHHDHVGAELLEHRAVALFGRVVAAEVEHLDVARRVAHDAGVVPHREEPHVPVVVLHGLLAQRPAFLAAQHEAFRAAGLARISAQPVVLVGEQALEALRRGAIRASPQLELEHAEIDADLELRAAVVTGNPPGVDASGLIWPAQEQRSDVVFFHVTEFTI